MHYNLPHIKILATGGTIAGVADKKEQLTGYASGALGVENLLAAVPGITDFAAVSGEQIANIGSENMTSDVWLRLARRCNEVLAQDDVQGVVITHGTDTMEETAYFLHLTLRSAKPVVLTGAMRPATAVSADGPLNLLQAVKLAASPQAAGKGVLVMLNDEIFSARDVVKINTTNAAAFKAPSLGALGCFAGGEPYLYYAPLRRHTLQSVFAPLAAEKLPRVDIVYTHCDEDGVLVRAAVAAGAKGIVYAGSGMGSIHAGAEDALRDAVAGGVKVVRSSRVVSGVVAPGLMRWTEMGFLDGDNLNPQKARILLQLALTRTNNLQTIQHMFKEY